MIINTVLGNVFQDQKWTDYAIDYLDLEWYELNKRVMRKITTNMFDVGINITQENSTISDGDVLGINRDMIIVVKVMPCECIAIRPKNPLELARVCYEIGNRHTPLFIDEHDSEILLLAMDNPLMLMLKKIGAEPKFVFTRLVKSLTPKVSNMHEHHH